MGKVDNLGRVCIPIALRNRHKIGEGDYVRFIEENGKLVVLRINKCCAICKSEESLKDIVDLTICEKCLEKVRGAK